ncbi:hypothetical protein [Arthrobacter sp. H41]|uniref:hypothetical protein n=1 Tax=Arthrobacter sp. H41 TaxID=1312978 RepID=UPI00047E6CFB|nr:hypothetical protein [Arthrobacter sp. H41]
MTGSSEGTAGKSPGTQDGTTQKDLAQHDAAQHEDVQGEPVRAPRFLTLGQVAEELNTKESLILAEELNTKESLIRALIRTGELAAIQVGGRGYLEFGVAGGW